MGKRYFSVIGMVCLIAVALAACGSEGEDDVQPTVTRIPDAANAPVLTPTGESSEGTPAAGSPMAVEGSPAAGTPSVASPVAASPAAQAAALEIVSKDIAFDPVALNIPADTAVVISLPNEGAGAHNFSIDALDVSIDLAPGEVKEVDINAPAGEYEYYCNVPGHREAGMAGTLTVE